MGPGQLRVGFMRTPGLQAACTSAVWWVSVILYQRNLFFGGWQGLGSNVRNSTGCKECKMLLGIFFDLSMKNELKQTLIINIVQCTYSIFKWSN